MWIKKRVKYFFILFFIGITGIIFIYYHNVNSDNIIDVTSENQTDAPDNKETFLKNLDKDSDNESESHKDSLNGISDANTEDEEKNDISGEIFIYVCGQVINPGVYELSTNARVVDAISAAGGVTDKAAEEYINQAELLSDGLRVYVPSTEDVKDMDLLGNINSTNSDSVLSESEDKESDECSEEKININTASKEELMSLPGIGEAKAEDIIEYRESEGNFESIEAVMNVTGIKEGLFNKISDYITI